jgi:hypothetical protein
LTSTIRLAGLLRERLDKILQVFPPTCVLEAVRCAGRPLHAAHHHPRQPSSAHSDRVPRLPPRVIRGRDPRIRRPLGFSLFFAVFRCFSQKITASEISFASEILGFNASAPRKNSETPAVLRCFPRTIKIAMTSKTTMLFAPAIDLAVRSLYHENRILSID